MSIACRESMGNTLLRCAEKNQDIVVVTSDARGSAMLSGFAEKFPDRFVEVGIAEQNAVGIAAGLARCGKQVFVSGPACFYSARGLEQVKNDVAYSGTNVKIIAVSGGVAYGALASTHHSLHDVAVFRAIPGIDIVLPSDGRQTEAITEYFAEVDTPVYMRMGRGKVPDIYAADAPFREVYRHGKGNTLRQGSDCTIIAAGQLVYHAVEAGGVLSKQDISVCVIDMPTIKPLDTELILTCAEQTGAIVTAEEHSIYGGLGSAVAETCAQNLPVPMRIMGIPDEPAIHGTQNEIFVHYGLTTQGIIDAVLQVIAMKKDQSRR